jgi:hypothetical protein
MAIHNSLEILGAVVACVDEPDISLLVDDEHGRQAIYAQIPARLLIADGER